MSRRWWLRHVGGSLAAGGGFSVLAVVMGDTVADGASLGVVAFLAYWGCALLASER